MNRDVAAGGSDNEECARALERVYEFLDHELDTANAQTIADHLAACEPCLDTYDLEQMVKSLIHRSCGGEVAPAALRQRVMISMTTVWREVR
jgi:anti-sigma factor (TIGR02949 family)